MLINRNKYTNKYLEILETIQFIKLNHHPTKSFQGKIQQLLRKFQSKLLQKEYFQLYLIGSCSTGKFYGAAKIHKLPPDCEISNLPLRLII